MEYRARCNADGRQQEVGPYGEQLHKINDAP